jgi:hypothetical protein
MDGWRDRAWLQERARARARACVPVRASERQREPDAYACGGVFEHVSTCIYEYSNSGASTEEIETLDRQIRIQLIRDRTCTLTFIQTHAPRTHAYTHAQHARTHTHTHSAPRQTLPCACSFQRQNFTENHKCCGDSASDLMIHYCC